MNNNWKKKAFTLTELLVVVIVIGVLSAVVLPKFSKVVETRKTTEAEEMMAAVRTEQEKRCALDKAYTTDAATVNLASLNTKNFNYTLKNTGIEAASKGKYGYTLKMPSYRDGRLCCDSAEQCAKLNKNYPACNELIAKADYTSGAECAADVKSDSAPTIACSGSSTQACGCKNGGTQTRTCDTTTGTWSAWSTCSIADTCSCTAAKPSTSQTCNSCGTQTRTVTCNTTTGEWVAGAWGTCNLSGCTKNCDESSKPATSQTCNSCGTQTRTVTCNTTTGVWTTSVWNTCSKTQAECSQCNWYEAQKCEQPQGSNTQSGYWDDETCTCSCPSQTTLGSDGECEEETGGSSSGGSSEGCTWQTVAYYLCGEKVENPCRGYEQYRCALNDYCPGGGQQVEVCM